MFELALLIGFAISLLCKKIVLVIYCLLPQLRNLQGKIFICHYISECIFSTLFLIRASNFSLGLEEDTYSFLLAFFFLATFTWLALLNVDLCLASYRSPGTALNLPGFLLYFFIGWAEPAAILALDIYVVSDISLAVCECAFKALLTAVLFTLTAWKTSRLRRRTDRELPTETEDTRGFFLHTKLALIVGLIWLTIQLVYAGNLIWPQSPFRQCFSVIISLMVLKDVLLFISLVKDKLVIKGFNGL